MCYTCFLKTVFDVCQHLCENSKSVSNQLSDALLLELESYSVIMAISYYVNEYWDDIADPTLNYIFPGGPWLLLLLIAGYLLIVLRIGPDFMKDREPYQLKTLIKYYNIINISSNAFVFLITLYWSRFTIDCWRCLDSY